MTIWERVKTALTTLTIPVSEGINLQATGTIPAQKPTEYVVYSLISAPPEQFGDNEITMRSFRVQVSFYSLTGLTGMPDIESLMTAAGFSCGPITELPYDQSAGYYGVALEYVFTESED